MKTLKMVSLFLALTAMIISANATDVSGPVSGTWTLANSPYIVVGDITVPANDSLIIESNVEIRFEPNVNMTVYGALRANGALGDSIQFTSNLPNPQPGSWGSLRIRDGGCADLNFCAFEYGTLLFGFDNQYLNVNDSRIGFPLGGEPESLTTNRCVVPNNQTFNGGHNIVLRTTNFGGLLEFLDSGGSYTVDSCTVVGNLNLWDYAASFYVYNSAIGGNVPFTHHGTAHLANCQIAGSVTGGDNLYINGCTILNGIAMENFGEFGTLNLDSSDVHGGIVSSDMIHSYLNNNTITGDVYMDYTRNMILAGNTINGSLTGAMSSMGGLFSVINNRFIGGGVNVKAPFPDMSSAPVKNNQSINSPGDGIRLIAWGYAGDYTLTIESNTIYHAGENGIALYDSGEVGGSQDAVVKNNIIANCSGFGVRAVQMGTVTAVYNDAWTNSAGNYSGLIPGTGSISSDPQFVDAYHLRQQPCQPLPQSPCVNTGDPASTMIIGSTRTDDVQDQGIVDMGYHYTPAIPPPPPTWDVNITPINPPIIIHANGGVFQYNINVHNLLTTPQTFSVWNKIRQPGGTYVQVFGPVTRTLPGNANPTRTFTQTIAATIEPGLNYYISYIGTYPSTIIDSSYFTFTKLAVQDGGPWISESKCEGDMFDEYADEAVKTCHGMSLQAAVFPNPFNPTTAISYELPTSSFVKLDVYDVSGRLVAALVNGWREAGAHQLTFDGSSLASGIYLARFAAGNVQQTQKLILLK